MASEHQRLIAEALLKAEKKLEAVRKYLDTIVLPSVSDITNLKEILEAEG